VKKSDAITVTWILPAYADWLKTTCVEAEAQKFKVEVGNFLNHGRMQFVLS
jgi:hypothetical protein